MAPRASNTVSGRPGHPRVAIIGSGFSGLCMAIRLKQSGIESFTLLEKADRLGGTWRENTYPGCSCDIMAFAYCYSFEQKTDWSRKWVPHDEILGYLDHCAEKYGILPHCRFGIEVQAARFDAEAGVWRIRTARNGTEVEEFEAEILVSGVGQLHRPVVPKIPGLDSFEGQWFHSAAWNHDVDLSGKRVGVVGNGASAIQFVPEIAPEVEQMSVFQRSPNWLIPRGDRPYTEAEKRRYARLPWLAKLYRGFLWARQELLFSVMVGQRFFTRKWTQMSLDHMHESITDPVMREALTPDYPIGAKRILIHDDYFPALARDNVALVTSQIERIEGSSVITEDGQSQDFDVLIMATGFDTNSFLAPMAIEGLGGRMLEQEWKDGAEAFLGLTVTGFPNLFLMYGPNTNLGHNSIVFMIECQTNYILSCVEEIRRKHLLYLDVLPETQQRFNEKLQHDLDRTAWAKVDHSWYKTDSGKITNNWSGPTIEYWWRTRNVDFREYREVR
jgi:cation diffusion facilitator CzcD-associated flavoprotein CzcO